MARGVPDRTHRGPGRHPPLPPPPPGHGGGTPVGRPSRLDRASVIKKAVTAVASGLTRSDPGLSQAQALHFANLMLTRPGVSLGQGGKIFYNGQRFAPEAFASSGLAQLATGQRAAAQNKAAITGDPNYITDMANLGLQRDQATAGLGDQQRQALIQFGDPTFSAGDQQTAAEASTNPFSTERLQAQQYQQNLGSEQAQANRLGVLQGGGAIAGKQAAQNAYAAQTQDAVTKMTQLLSQIQQEQAAAQQAYGVGQGTAYTNAYNALLASGAIHAAKPPAWSVGTFKVRPPRGGGAAGAGPPGSGIGGFKGFKPPPYYGGPATNPPPGLTGAGLPPAIHPGAPGILSPGPRGGSTFMPTPGTPLLPNAAELMRRFGIGG